MRQHGRRLLFTELEAAHQWWLQEGRPECGRFGTTVTQDAQSVWLDEPGRVVARVA